MPDIACPVQESKYLNDDSIRFHSRLGFSEVGRFHDSGYKFNQWFDMVWMEKMSTALLITLVLAAVVGYVVVLVSYIGIASHLYNKKHQEARQRVKRYNHILTRLLKMYEKETK